MKDEEKQQLNFAIIEPRSASVPRPVEKTLSSAQRYVYFGEDNLYPEYLLSCYNECSTLQSVINGTADYVAGKGFTDKNLETLPVNEKDETLLEVVQKCVIDSLIFGAFSLGIRRDKEKNIAALDYRDVRQFRLSEDGKTAYWCKDWAKGSRKVVSYPVFSPRDVEASSSILYHKTARMRGIYGLPLWSSATKDVQTAIEISTFHLSSILNNFAPSAIVNFNNGVPDENTQKTIEKGLNKKFSGAENASRLLVCFNDSRMNATTIERLVEDHFDQRYSALAKSVKENIFIAFRAHPQLFGADPERQGFNAVEYEQTFKLFKETVIVPMQRDIEAVFKYISERYSFTLDEFNIDFDTDAKEGATI